MAELMQRYMPGSNIWIPKPTWSNHHKYVALATATLAAVKYHLIQPNGAAAHSHLAMQSVERDVICQTWSMLCKLVLSATSNLLHHQPHLDRHFSLVGLHYSMYAPMVKLQCFRVI